MEEEVNISLRPFTTGEINAEVIRILIDDKKYKLVEETSDTDKEIIKSKLK